MSPWKSTTIYPSWKFIDDLPVVEIHRQFTRRGNPRQLLTRRGNPRQFTRRGNPRQLTRQYTRHGNPRQFTPHGNPSTIYPS